MNSVEDRDKGVWWPIILVTALVIGVLYVIRGSLPPLILAGITAYLISPIVDLGERHTLPRWASISIVYLTVGGVIVLGFVFLVPLVVAQAQDMQVRVRSIWPHIPGYIDAATAFVQEKVPATANLMAGMQSGEQLISTVQQWSAKALAQVPVLLTRTASSVVSVVSYFVIVPFIAFFLIRDGRDFKRAFVRMLPNRYFEASLNVMSGIGESVGAYLRGLLLEALILGVVATAGLFIIGLEYPVLVGLLAGMTNLIPYLGPVVGVLAGCIVAVATGGSIIGVLIVFAIAQFFDNWVVQPVVLSRSVQLHPLLIFLAVIFGGTYGGILGMVLAVPLTGATIVSIRKLSEGLQPPVYPYTD